jgi:nucleotide-binding universal stress UspA family protein
LTLADEGEQVMELKDVLVLLDGATEVAVPYAVSLAGQFGAHLTGADVVPPILGGVRIQGLPQFVIDSQLAEAKREQAAREAVFLGAAQGGGVTAEMVPIRGSVEGAARQFAVLARHFDLTVLAQTPHNNGVDEAMLEAALFGSARPVLMVPFVHRAAASFDRIMVAWDRSEVAARAIAGAMPLLARAKLVQVVTASMNHAPDVDHPGFNIARHLARHGLPVELKVVATTIDIGNTLLSLAADEGSDLLVMGAYGHSRLRELILGGTTRDILKTMTLPVLMAH